MMRILVTVALVGLPLEGLLSSASQAPHVQAQQSTGGSTQWISSSVVGSWVTERSGDGPERLRLGSEISSSGAVAGRTRQAIRYGDIQLSIEVDWAGDRLTLQDRTFGLDGRNVVLVDDVDGASGPRVTAMLRVPPEMPGSAAQIARLMTRSPEIMAFLRCDAPIPLGMPSYILEGLCLQNLGVAKPPVEPEKKNKALAARRAGGRGDFQLRRSTSPAGWPSSRSIRGLDSRVNSKGSAPSR